MRELNLAFDSVVAGTMRTWNDISRHFGVPIDILQTLNWEVVEPVDSGQTLVIPRIVEPLSPTMVIEWSIEWSNVDDHRVHAWDTSLPADYQSDRPETDTPLPANYMIVTEDDLLRWMWEHYFSRNPEQYDAQEAQRLFQAQLVDEIIHRARPSQTTIEGWSWMFVNEGTETDQLIDQLIDTPNRETFLGELTPEQLWAIYNQLPRNSVQNRDPAWDYFVSLYQNVQVTAQGGTLDNDLWDPSGVFQEDLALQDFFQQQMGTTDPAEIERMLFDIAVDLLVSGVADRTQLGLNAEASEDDIRDALHAQLGEHATIDDLMALIYQWTSQSQLAEDSQPLEWPQPLDDSVMGPIYDAQYFELTARYYDALALDNLRRIAYDRTQVEDARLLIDLRAQVDAMPLVVLGVDISFVHDTLQTYLEAMEAYQRWREQLKDNIEEIDRLMLERQGQEQEPLWWLLEIPLSILVEPLDWLFTIRDLFQGDWTALVGLLPLVPSAIRNITDAARFLPNVPQGFQDILARFDDFLHRFEDRAPREYYQDRGIDRNWQGRAFAPEDLDANGHLTNEFLEGHGIRTREDFEIYFGSLYSRGVDELPYGVRISSRRRGSDGEWEDIQYWAPLEITAFYDENDNIVSAWVGTTVENADASGLIFEGGTHTRDRTGYRRGIGLTHLHVRGTPLNDIDIDVAILNRLREMRAFYPLEGEAGAALSASGRTFSLPSTIRDLSFTELRSISMEIINEALGGLSAIPGSNFDVDRFWSRLGNVLSRNQKILETDILFNMFSVSNS